MADGGGGGAGGGDAESAPEGAVRGGLGRAPREGGGGGGRGACFEEAPGPHDALADLEGVGRDAGDGSELSNEVELGGGRGVREFVERHVHGEVVLQMLRRDANGREVGSSFRVLA